MVYCEVLRRPFVTDVAGGSSGGVDAAALCHYHPMTSTKKSLSSKVTFASLTPNNLGTVRKLNSVLFPIKYSEQFYNEILLSEVEDFCKLSTFRYHLLRSISVLTTFVVYYNDIPVGTICCRLESKDSANQLYLLTMGILAVRVP